MTKAEFWADLDDSNRVKAVLTPEQAAHITEMYRDPMFGYTHEQVEVIWWFIWLNQLFGIKGC